MKIPSIVGIKKTEPRRSMTSKIAKLSAKQTKRRTTENIRQSLQILGTVTSNGEQTLTQLRNNEREARGKMNKPAKGRRENNRL